MKGVGVLWNVNGIGNNCREQWVCGWDKRPVIIGKQLRAPYSRRTTAPDGAANRTKYVYQVYYRLYSLKSEANMASL